ncbi:hypothetical protein [Nesterenkonia aurantiaca]|uniref:Uncharacterized protein n=1 Tax=Nesterenkonia aurantiaca TaxID=1436010 RepID=A0A4R7G6M1_9MICC|nr:hypothetical protein [Nesterenkonia aurantiaca]TDS86860.1 hypothetical protein EV640_102155 [Nesterenkonia aurantiaca]
METMLVQTFNAFFLAAVVLSVPVLIVAGIWVAAVELRRPDRAAAELQSETRTAHQS